MIKTNKHFTLTLRVTTFTYKQHKQIFEYYDDQVTDLVLSNDFHNISFVFNNVNFTISAEYWQSENATLILAVLNERMKLMHEEFPATKIHLKILESEPTEPRKSEGKLTI